MPQRIIGIVDVARLRHIDDNRRRRDDVVGIHHRGGLGRLANDGHAKIVELQDDTAH